MICATVRGSLHREQMGLSSPRSRNPWVSYVWLIRSLQRVASSRLFLRELDTQGLSVGLKPVLEEGDFGCKALRQLVSLLRRQARSH